MLSGEEIKQLREALGMSREELAQKLGVSYFSVARWEIEKTKPSRLALRALEDLRKRVKSKAERSAKREAP